MSNKIDKIIDQYSPVDHAVLAGPDWPSFKSIKNRDNIPDFVVNELIDMYVLPDETDTTEVKSPQPSYVEFYITNVCNFDCSDCRSFNNFDFKGHYHFDLDFYSMWAEKMHLDSFVLLGGEPLLHPGLSSWVEGTRKLWPNAVAKIDSNGSYIKKARGLERLLLDNNFFLCINIHNPGHLEKIMQDVIECFGPCREVDIVDVAHLLGQHTVVGTYLISNSGLFINLRPAIEFDSTIASTTDWQKLALSSDKSAIYMGDATKNHDDCSSTTCHVMLDGKIYKCATMATLPVFLKQKQLQWPDPLLDLYQPLTIDNYSQEKHYQLEDCIPQCTYCNTRTKVDVSNSGVKQSKNKIFKIHGAT